jgi:hypothetical protein
VGSGRHSTSTVSKRKEKLPIRARCFVHQRRLSRVKRVQCISDRMSHVVLRGRWCNNIVLNTQAPTQDKSDGSGDSFNEQLEQVFDYFLHCHTKKSVRRF